MDEEARTRIAYLNEGPWIEKGKLAWQKIAKPVGVVSVEPSNSATQLALKDLLRPHWVKSIVYEEGLARDSFDEALTIYQLYELAIENRYIDLADIQPQVTAELERLLWSEGARNFLQTYGYASVIFLVQRVGLDLGFKPVDLPPIREGTEGRFASFLSQHALWYEDPVLDGWLGFLDDYIVLPSKGKSDKTVFRRFLATEEEPFDDEAMLWMFVAGAERFVTRIADLSDSLSEEERPSYGTFYSYWLVRTYGYALEDGSYVRDTKRVDWSEAILTSKRIMFFNDKRRKIMGSDVDLLESFKWRDRAVRVLWADTLKHLNSKPHSDPPLGLAH